MAADQSSTRSIRVTVPATGATTVAPVALEDVGSRVAGMGTAVAAARHRVHVARRVARRRAGFAGHLNRLTALSEADDVTLEDVAEFVCTQRRSHPRRKGADVVGTLAHTLAGADEPGSQTDSRCETTMIRNC